MPNWLRFPLTLAVIAAVAGGGLAFVEVRTRERVAENKKRKLSAAFKEVPGCEENREIALDEDLIEDYGKGSRCFKLLGASGSLIAYAAQVRCTDPQCYNSTDPIVLVVVLDAKVEKVLLVRTTNNKETPGLGTRVSAKRPAHVLIGEVPGDMAENPFLDQFRDRPLGKLDYKEAGLDAITGATVSSNAVLGGVKKAVRLLKEVAGN